MNKEKLNNLPAHEITTLINEEKISSQEVVIAAINQVKKYDDKLNTWTYFDSELAIKQARLIDEKKTGNSFNLLKGVPVGVKDIFNTKDMPTCMGSPIWAGFTPGNDARAVFNLKRNNAVILGKTVTAELGIHYPGPTVNPHNFEHSPGTSSSGSAVAVASRMAPLAIGSQTAGSTIRPASYCGIYGFKPSFGLIPRTGMLKTTDTLDHVTCFSRSVVDLELIFKSLKVSGRDYPLANNLGNINENNKLWKIAVIKGPTWKYAEDYAKSELLDFVSKMSENNILKIEELELPSEFDLVHKIHEKIYCKCLSYYFKNEYDNHKNKISESTLSMIEKGKKISLNEYTTLLGQQIEISNLLNNILKKYDTAISLSTAGIAPKGIYSREKPDNSLIWTFCGLPAMNLPLFEGPKGLPFGAQIITNKRRDFDLINFAKFLENNKFIPKIKCPASLLN